jgi:hypothetical protein
MKTYWTATLKPQVLEGIKKANITNKDVIKLILKLNKSVSTCRTNMAYGMSWDLICHSDAYNRAYDALEDLYHGAEYGERTIFADDYEEYCNANGILAEANLGDWLA